MKKTNITKNVNGMDITFRLNVVYLKDDVKDIEFDGYYTECTALMVGGKELTKMYHLLLQCERGYKNDKYDKMADRIATMVQEEVINKCIERINGTSVVDKKDKEDKIQALLDEISNFTNKTLNDNNTNIQPKGTNYNNIDTNKGFNPTTTKRNTEGIEKCKWYVPNTNVSFDDIAGMDAEKEEILEICDAFKNREKYEKMGVKTNLNIGLFGNPGCVDKDTEFFNGTKWVKISEYKEGDKVLIYDNDGTARLEFPQRYIKEECEEMTLITNASGSINQCLSDEHRVMYTTHKDPTPRFIQFKDFEKQYKSNKGGFGGLMTTAFNYEGKGIELSDEEIRVMVMTMADGHLTSNNTNYCTLRLSKNRKIERAKELLRNANLEFKVNIDEKNDFTIIHYYAPRKEKVFGDFWYECNKHQLEVILEECLKWDGHSGRNRDRFSTTIKENADFIQFVSTALGKRSTISTLDRRGTVKITDGKEYTRHSIEYTVILTNQNKLGLMAKKDRPRMNFTKYKTIDGLKYCFTVSTGMLVLRRNSRIFVTGNCGKTLMAKALATELDVNFFSVESNAMANKYVGMAAKNIREAFEEARKYAPSIIFWDECDGLLGKRTAETDGGNGERNSGVNQFLTELDGFRTTDDVIVIIASNFESSIDDAVLRPGRISKKINISDPDYSTRLGILKINAKNKPMADDVDLEKLARNMSGANSATVANVINTAGLLAVRRGYEEIHQQELLDAFEREFAGLESKTKRLNADEVKIVSTHESGHAMINYILGGQKIQKISIIPRTSSTLGFVLSANEEEDDKFLSTKEEMENRIVGLLGGRASEELVFGKVTGGCSNDLMKATRIAESMVCQLGMNDNFGLMSINPNDVFMRGQVLKEVKIILDDCYKKAMRVLAENRDKLDKLSAILIEKESMDYDDFISVVEA